MRSEDVVPGMFLGAYGRGVTEEGGGGWTRGGRGELGRGKNV